MANNPIDINGFEHYLNFVSLGIYDYQISAPPGSEAANFIVSQRDEAFGRDIILGNDKMDVTFFKQTKELGTREQVVDIDGRRSKYLDYGFAWIMESLRLFGFEAKIEYVLKKNGSSFTIGQLDVSEPDTDRFSRFSCSIIQLTAAADYKRQLDTSINILGTRNFKDKTITPAPTMRVLHKATPIYSVSKFKNHPFAFDGEVGNFEIVQAIDLTADVSAPVYFNRMNEIVKQELEITKNWEDDKAYSQAFSGVYNPSRDTFKIYQALQRTTGISVIFKVKFKVSFQNDQGFSNERAKFRLHCFGGDTGTFDSNFPGITSFAWESQLLGTDTGILQQEVDEEIVVPIGDLPIGGGIWSAFSFNASSKYALYKIEYFECTTEIRATKNNLDNVISAVRYIDVIKQCSKYVNDLPVDAAMFDQGGAHYDNVCWNRALISMKTSNSLALESNTLPEGESIGQVVYNTNPDALPIGLAFWNSTNWISLASDDIPDIELTSDVLPAGAFEGDLAYNTNLDVTPNGLVFWNGTAWVSLELTSPFITSIKDAFEAAMTIETCSDYEIKNDKIYFGGVREFYKNKEVGKFLIDVDKGFTAPFNDRAKNNNIKFGFDTYEQNRLSPNTTRDIHTETELTTPITGAENKIDKSIKYIRSVFSAQAMFDLENKTPQTSDENDDKVFITRIVELPPGTFCQFNSRLSMQLSGGNVVLANKSSDIQTDEIYLNWNTRGLVVGQTFTIVSGENPGNYKVVSFERTFVVLEPQGFTPTFNGDANVVIRYEYINIGWQSKTKEGFDLIEGINTPESYGNLDYSLGNIIDAWLVMLATNMIYYPTGKIKSRRFKNNPKLRTKKPGNRIVVEAGDIPASEMPDPLISDTCYELEVFADFQEVLDLLIALDNDRGFIRCYGIDDMVILGFIKELEYVWSTGKLILNLEEKYQPSIVRLVYSNGTLFVNDVEYDISGNAAWYKFSNGFFICYDEDCVPLCKINSFRNVSLNGVIYESEYDLQYALEQL